MSQECTFFLDPRKCKQRWESLRAQFRKHIRGQKTKTGQAASFQTKWKYEDHMEFLRAYMKDKVRITSVTGENEDPSFIADEEDENDTRTQIYATNSKSIQFGVTKKENPCCCYRNCFQYSNEAHPRGGEEIEKGRTQI